MRPHNIFALVLACPSIHTFTSAGLVALHARSPGQSFTKAHLKIKDDPVLYSNKQNSSKTSQFLVCHHKMSVVQQVLVTAQTRSQESLRMVLRLQHLMELTAIMSPLVETTNVGRNLTLLSGQSAGLRTTPAIQTNLLRHASCDWKASQA